MTPPLRFLLGVITVWTCLRALAIASPWSSAGTAAAPLAEAVADPGPSNPRIPIEAAGESGTHSPLRSSRAKSRGVPAEAFRRGHVSHAAVTERSFAPATEPRPSTSAFRPKFILSAAASGIGGLGATVLDVRLLPGTYPPLERPTQEWRAARGLAAGRWSASAWSFLREGAGPSLAPGGTLGGAQAGVRVGYRLTGDPARPLALSVRLSSPLRQPAGTEGALGLDWKPSTRLPLHLLAERRQAMGREGRSAFGLTLYGGLDSVRLGSVRLDAYGQAGIVGMRRRDLFADGAARLSLPLAGQGRLRAGLGVWGAAQPGAARLDLGPSVSLSLPIAGRNVTATSDWRLRAAGRARPGSGPALTLATDF